MVTLVFGGAASGKSEYAESLLLLKKPEHPIYLATMEPYGEEGARRVERHRRLRAGKGFSTVERCTGLCSLVLPAHSGILLEDLGNLCANELFSPTGAGADAAQTEILSGITSLAKQAQELIIVSNDIFSGCEQYEGEMARYLALMGTLHREIARMAHYVVEIVCGIPIFHKGGTPC